MNKDKRNLPRDSRHNRVPRNVNLQEEYQSKVKEVTTLMSWTEMRADVTLDMFTYVCFAVPCFLNLFKVSLQVLSYIFLLSSQVLFHDSTIFHMVPHAQDPQHPESLHPAGADLGAGGLGLCRYL